MAKTLRGFEYSPKPGLIAVQNVGETLRHRIMSEQFGWIVVIGMNGPRTSAFTRTLFKCKPCSHMPPVISSKEYSITRYISILVL